jgi:glycosyltransferase 2 family protein
MSVSPQSDWQHTVPGPDHAVRNSGSEKVLFKLLAPSKQKSVKKKWMQFAVRALITLLLFASLLRSTSWSTMVTTLIHVHHTLLLLGLAAGVVCILFSAYCWRSLVLAERIQTDLARLINLYLVGIAFSHFLPTNMGGDAIKAFYIARDSGNIAGATSSVLMSRITSFFGMLLIALPVLAIMHAEFPRAIITWFLLLSLLLVGAIGGTIFAAALLPGISARFLKGAWTKHRILVTVIEIGNAVKAATGRLPALCAAILYGTLFWIANFLNYYGYAAALGLHVPLTFYVIAIPFVSIIAALPISINGFGVREGAFVYLFTTIHVPASSSLLIAFLVDAQVLLFGIIGGCIYLTMSNKTSIAQFDI